MTLLQQTIILFLGMGVFSALPTFWSRLDHFSRTLFLIGTGAIAGLCVFDLVPDVFELGGKLSLYVVAGVWLVYSLAHYFHIGHHHLDHEHLDYVHLEQVRKEGVSVFFFSLFAHCFSSGMLLAVSEHLSQKIAGTVFVALAAHKGYEALMVSTVLNQRVRHKTQRIFLILGYSLALPLGVLFSFVFRESWSREVAIWVSSVALGTLLGCVLFDFIIPSLHHLRKNKKRLGWIALGLVVTQVIVKRL